MPSKALLIIISGIAGDPVARFGGLTPLEHARLPTIDRMARDGITGILHLAGKGRDVQAGMAGFYLLGVDPGPPGSRLVIPRFKDTFGVEAAFISGSPAMEVPCMSAMLTPALTEHDENLDKKLAATWAAMEDNDLVLVHVHATDPLHAAGDHEALVALLERIDAVLVAPLARAGPHVVVAITTDHHRDTSGRVTSAGVPVVIQGDGVRRDDVQRFTERDCASGGLVEIDGKDLVYVLLDLLGKIPKLGLEED